MTAEFVRGGRLYLKGPKANAITSVQYGGNPGFKERVVLAGYYGRMVLAGFKERAVQVEGVKA